MVPEVRDVQPAKDFIDGDDPEVMAHWALLVAGSAGWGNYRQVGCFLQQQYNSTTYSITSCAPRLGLYIHFAFLRLPL